jgi:hypothetical protein
VIAVEAAPDRGDGYGLVKNLQTGQSFQIDGGSDPIVSHTGRYVAMAVKPSLLKVETSDAKAKKKLKADMLLLDTQTGTQTRFERVKEFTFSDDGEHLAIWFEADEEANKDAKDKAEAAATADDKPKADKVKVDKFDQGRRFSLVHLSAPSQRVDVENVTAYSFAKDSRRLALAVNDIEAKQHQLQLVDLKNYKKSTAFESQTQQVGALALAKSLRPQALRHRRALGQRGDPAGLAGPRAEPVARTQAIDTARRRLRGRARGQAEVVALGHDQELLVLDDQPAADAGGRPAAPALGRRELAAEAVHVERQVHRQRGHGRRHARGESIMEKTRLRFGPGRGTTTPCPSCSRPSPPPSPRASSRARRRSRSPSPRRAA